MYKLKEILMENIDFQTEQIRVHVNENDLLSKFFNDDDKWNLLCVSMDTLEDSIEALKYYEQNGIGEDDNSKYLHLYGVFQSIILQQDSIKNLYSIFNNGTVKLTEYSSWFEIRDLRNAVTGHPTQKGFSNDIKRIYLSRISINDEGFDLIIWNKKNSTSEYVHIDFKDIYTRYKNDALRILKNVHQALLKNWL